MAAVRNEKHITKLAVLPTLKYLTSKGFISRRTAAYARVSTNREEQLNSIEAQKDYYVRFIAGNPSWEFSGLYVDEGISGTSHLHRDGFNKMIKDALGGKFDLIVTKSISRFARNTVDTLTSIRDLKAVDVEVYFEKENIFTLDSKGEFLITLMSSLAQEESRSISENVAWGIRKRFSDGKVSIPYGHFLGYDKGKDGNLQINEAEAVTVCLIYKMFLEGLAPHTIANHLTATGIPSPGGKAIWNHGAVRSMLSNEKYKGDALLQKGFTVDFLTKKKKANEGELPQYYIKDNHQAIIAPPLFELVQQELKKRVDGKYRHSGVSIFSSKIRCGDCGAWYGSKRWHSTSLEYNDTVWQCNRRYDYEEKCKTPHLYDELLRYAFGSAMLYLLSQRPQLMSICSKLTTTTIRASKYYGSKGERASRITKYIDNYLSLSPKDVAQDESVWAVLVERVEVTAERKLIFNFIDDSHYIFDMPDFSPRYRNNLK